MIWLIVSVVIGGLLALFIDRERPGKYNSAVLCTVMVLWPVLLLALLFTTKEEVDKWRE